MILPQHRASDSSISLFFPPTPKGLLMMKLYPLKIIEIAQTCRDVFSRTFFGFAVSAR
jgi:hypothetical protein